MRIFMTGASGLIGRALTTALVARGDTVVALSRGGRAGAGAEVVTGDPTQAGAWQERIGGCDAVVHLAGESIGDKRWTTERKRSFRASRVDSGHQLGRALAALPVALRPRALLTASGVDRYPFDDSDRPYGEDAAAGDSFLADLCAAWEAATDGAAERVVALRTGVVLAQDGPFAKMQLPFKLFAGGPMGSGRQWLSWIHLDDAVGGILYALDHELRGPINLVGASTRQREFARALGSALHRPSWLPVPAFALRVAVGELAEYLLHGRRVVPIALQSAGYRFRYAGLAEALAQLVTTG